MPTIARRSEPLPRVVGWAALAVFVIFTAVGAVAHLGDAPVTAVVAAVVATALAALLIFGHGLGTLVGAVGSAAATTVLCNGDPANVAWFGLCVVVGWLALVAVAPVVLGAWALALLTLTGEAVFARHDPGWPAWIAGTTFSLVGCWFGSRQRDLVLELRAAQAGLALRAQAEERTRIARELHDVIAHSLTVSLLHVSSARLAVRDDPAEAERALAEAERLGRASLAEVRHAVGTLHRDGAPDPTAPLPGSTDVATLIDGFRSAGADVHVSIEGELDTLPATLGLATYRIVQEALTNAVKHAPQARTTVLVQVGDDIVTVEVDSAGQPRHGSDGLGLVGMRERAESVGGRFVAGPGGSGWRVHAELPLDPKLVSGP